MNRELEERTLFNKMISYHVKSCASDTPIEDRDSNFKSYELAKKELWKFQEEDND